jgi:hypothetical protein
MTLYGGNLLIIGVDLVVCNALATFFRTKGYTLHQVQTVEEGLSALQQQAFGVALLLEPIVSDMYGRKFLDIVVTSNPPRLVLTDPLKVGETKENEYIEREAFGLGGMSWDQGIPFLLTAANQPGIPPFQRLDLREIDVRLHAAIMIHRSNQLYAKFKKHKFKFLADTAREWLRFIDAESVSGSEVAALVAMVTQGRWSGPRWIGQAHYISRWARSLGFPGVDFDAIKNCLPEEPKENGH